MLKIVLILLKVLNSHVRVMTDKNIGCQLWFSTLMKVKVLAQKRNICFLSAIN